MRDKFKHSQRRLCRREAIRRKHSYMAMLAVSAWLGGR